MNGYAKEINTSEFDKLDAHDQVYYSVKIVEELLNDAHNARYMLHVINEMKSKKDLTQTFKFTRKTFLTQYILSLTKLLEGDSDRKRNKNFSIPQLNELVKKRLIEIQKSTPLSKVWQATTVGSIQHYESKLKRYKSAQDALFQFRGNETAHTNINYMLNQELRKKDIINFLTATSELLGTCTEIVTFYLKAFGEEPQTVPVIATELKGLALMRTGRQSDDF